MGNKVNRIDIWILLPVIVLVAYSLGVVYSASSSWSAKLSGDSSYLFKNHLIRAGVGLFMIFLFSRIDYRHLIRYRKFLMFAAVVMLMYLLVAGVETTKGATRWIRFAGMSFQPADFVKFALVINIAYMLSKKKDYISSLYYAYLPMIFYIMVIVVLIVFQPNFSTAGIVFMTGMIMLYVGGAKLKHIAVTFISIIPLAAIFVLSKPYILNRIFAFSGHNENSDAGYQLSQAIIGFGNGALIGVGPGNSTQRDFFLPQSYDDFVFSIVGEEYGFIGVTLVILTFGIFLYRGLKLSKSIDEDFGKYLAFGITITIIINAVINMMVSTGVIPTTGVTLPFMSYGGTSIIFNSIAVGILLNISTNRTNPKEAIWLNTISEDDK